MRRAGVLLSIISSLLLLPPTRPALAEDSRRGERIPAARAAGPITVDGDLSDPGWATATKVTTWYETAPGDNLPAKLVNVGYLAYDDRYFYAGLEFHDPDPSRIKAPYADRDNVSFTTDYGGIILDSRNDGRTGVLFLANPRGIQYDAVTDDGNEDSSPDFYWDAAGKITATGWNLEIRIPFRSLRYPKLDPQDWGILLYRNYPRDFRYTFFSAKLPRGSNCFICHENTLTGMTGLPKGGSLIVAPYGTARQEGHPRETPGTGFTTDPIELDGGLDVKWNPNAVTAVDGTFNPDFSQIESDTAQITANERFALFYPEKRPFFLEGLELLNTPIQAAYTRTITQPRWGLKATGKLDSTAYTLLVADDRGGGSAVLPGPLGSDFADQDFGSFVAVGRARHDLGASFVSFLATDREVRGGGRNLVLGPDFLFRPTKSHQFQGQLLYSVSDTPDRPELASEWNGQRLSGHAIYTSWFHSTPKLDIYTEYRDLADGFRADTGFVPQVGFRYALGELGWTFRPTGFFSRVRVFTFGDYTADREGRLLERQVTPGFGMDFKGNSFARFTFPFERYLTDGGPISRHRAVFTLQTSPSSLFGYLSLTGSYGQEIDFANSRPGHGGRLTLNATVRPGDHLALDLLGERRWVDTGLGQASRARGTPTGRAASGTSPEARLFTAWLGRAKATYTFTSRIFVRLIGQWVEVTRDPARYDFDVSRRSGDVSLSALLAWKLNWQSVVFLGYGDSRALNEDGDLEKVARQLFLKVSWSFQL